MKAQRVTSLLVAVDAALISIFQAPQAASAAMRIPAAPIITPIAQITAADAGKKFTIQGTVLDTSNFSVGFKLVVNDSTSQLIVLIWDDDYDYIHDSSRLNTGAVVRVTGKVDVYQGDLELIPDWGRDVQVVKPTPKGWRKYPLGALTGNDHNAVVWIEGVIADIQPFSAGTVLLVADGSGAQPVKLYDAVARRIPRQEDMWIGQRVSVVGRVRAKRNTGIEIVVALPQDVVVLNPVKRMAIPHTETLGVLSEWQI